jgi:M6 family metalloprotease-like protein
MKKYIILITFFTILVSFTSSEAAPLRNIPVTVTQPSGEVIHCFASGDEFYNWTHDKEGYVIIQSPDTGFYTYAIQENGRVVPSQYIVGEVDPERIGLEKEIKPSPAILSERMASFRRFYPERFKQIVPASQPKTIINLVFFIRFSDETEFTDPVSTYDVLFNNNLSGENSVKNYYYEVSYNQLTITTNFYPNRTGQTVVSYQDSHPRGYYQPYNAVTNPIGYQGGDDGQERSNREATLLKNVIDAFGSQVPSTYNIDADGDGNVDAVSFIIKGAPTGWASLLWPHHSELTLQEAYINGKRVIDFDLQLQTSIQSSGVGVLCHEMFHVLGAPDLYHYSYDGLTSVGHWDLMQWDVDPPQHMSAYMKYKYGGWISSLPIITQSGDYSLHPLTSSTNNVYRINSPNSSTEFFVVEYRKKTGTFESSLPGEGLLVYRINSSVRGNSEGPPDEVYVYRPGGTTVVDGNPDSANFSSDVGRTAINDSTDPSSFLSDGSDGGLNIYNIESPESTITFYVSIGGKPQPDFVVQSISLSPTSPIEGETFSATVTVKNQGTAPGSGGWLDIWKNSTSTATCGARGFKYASVGTLAAGASKTITFTGLTPESTGSKTFRAFVDSQCDTGESDEGNNQLTKAYTAEKGTLDFVVQSITLNPVSPTTGKTFTASVVVKNQGTASGNGGNLDIWVDNAEAKSCGATGNWRQSVGTLTAGGSKTASKTLTFTGLAGGSAGSKTFRVFVDSGCSAEETNETNNHLTKEYTVLGPDLVVQSITLNPSTPSAGGTFTASVVVKNQGRVSGSGGNLDVWVNQDTKQNCLSNGDKYASIGTLGAGASKTVTISGLSAGSAGTKTFRAFADSDCATEEPNEADNQLTKTYTVAESSKPEFTVTSITLNPESPVAGSTFSASMTVNNKGLASGDAGRLTIWINQSSSQSCGANGDKYTNVGTLAAGANKTITFTGLSAGTQGGKTFRAFADSQCNTAEVEEGNNQTTKTYTVVETAKPDFIVQSITFNPSTPTAGGTFTASVVVKNQGAGSGNGGDLDIWLNRAEAQSCGATGNWRKSVGTLAVGASKTLTFTGLAGGSSGAKTFRAFVDSQCITAEGDEENNQLTKAYAVE